MFYCEWALEVTYEKDPTKFCFNGRFSQEVMMENDGDIGRSEFLYSLHSSPDHTWSTLDFTISEFIVYLVLKFRWRRREIICLALHHGSFKLKRIWLRKSVSITFYPSRITPFCFPCVSPFLFSSGVSKNL